MIFEPPQSVEDSGTVLAGVDSALAAVFGAARRVARGSIPHPAHRTAVARRAAPWRAALGRLSLALLGGDGNWQLSGSSELQRRVELELAEVESTMRQLGYHEETLQQLAAAHSAEREAANRAKRDFGTEKLVRMLLQSWGTGGDAAQEEGAGMPGPARIPSLQLPATAWECPYRPSPIFNPACIP